MPVNATAYTLYLILERFQYFLEELDENGKVIYEWFGGSLRKRVGIVHKQLTVTYAFPKYTYFNNINRRICNGNPCNEYMLQFADFFAFAPWIKCESNGTKTRRYNEIKHKYYNLDHPTSRRRGNYEI